MPEARKMEHGSGAMSPVSEGAFCPRCHSWPSYPCRTSPVNGVRLVSYATGTPVPYAHLDREVAWQLLRRNLLTLPV